MKKLLFVAGTLGAGYLLYKVFGSRVGNGIAKGGRIGNGLVADSSVTAEGGVVGNGFTAGDRVGNGFADGGEGTRPFDGGGVQGGGFTAGGRETHGFAGGEKGNG